jgi:hypothetical protein
VNPQKGFVTTILFQFLNKHSEVTVFSFSPSATLQKVEQSVLRFLRIRMRLKTIFSWVSEDEDEVENNLFLSF